jgi:hypothetical protein
MRLTWPRCKANELKRETTMTFNTGDDRTPRAIHAELERIEESLGDTICTHDSPCGTVAYYDEESPTPWRISDDHGSESFATVDEAVAAAADWVAAYQS